VKTDKDWWDSPASTANEQGYHRLDRVNAIGTEFCKAGAGLHLASSSRVAVLRNNLRPWRKQRNTKTSMAMMERKTMGIPGRVAGSQSLHDLVRGRVWLVNNGLLKSED
jgi:hypothetical protein